MNAIGQVQSKRDVLGVTFFTGDPLRSYFDEQQKNEFYFLIVFFSHFCLWTTTVDILV